MSPTEYYFFSNNIRDSNYKKTESYTWFNTGEGQFIKNGLGRLYKEDGGKCESVF